MRNGMKRLVKILILFSPIILFSCFEYVSNGSSRQLLRILLAAPSDIARIHLGVYDGVVAPETELLRQTFDNGSQFTLQAPSGNNRIFLIYAEGYSGKAKYYGVTPPLTILENDDSQIVIRMQKFSTAETFNGGNSTGSRLTWNAIPGAYVYEVNISFAGLFKTTNNFLNYASPPPSTVRIDSSIFGIGSDSSPNFN